MKKYYPNLFSPLTINGVTFKNRIEFAPNMNSQTTNDGHPTDYLISYYETRARGGAGLVVVGDTPVDSKYAPGHVKYLRINPLSLPFLGELSSAIKEHGAVASIELNHAGRLADPAIIGRLPIGPVSETTKYGYEVIGMDKDLMNEVADSFAEATSLVKAAGFQMAMIHTGHMWLLNQFLSPLTNTRADEYGGSLENRARFPLMVLDRIRERVGDDFLIECRISGRDYHPEGAPLEDMIRFVKLAGNRIDLIHMSSGGPFDPDGTNPYSAYTGYGYNVGYSETMKKAVDNKVAVVGAISDPDFAESVISEGKADIIAMARAMIADPDWPNKARSGRKDEIRPCLRCQSCISGLLENHFFACSVNPIAAHEFRRGYVPSPMNRRKVLIAGGGPAGMQAAITAAERGHEVTIAEKGGELGGITKFTEKDAVKNDLRRFKNYLISKVTNLNIKVKLNSEVTPEYVELENPDVLIVAIGSEPVVPEIPGIGGENTMSILDYYNNPEKTGKKVLIIGGGLSGCEAALSLARNGHEVTIVEILDKLAGDANWTTNDVLMAQLKSHNVVMKTGSICTQILPKGIIMKQGKGEEFVEADSVIYAVGVREKRSEADSLRDLTMDYFAVGDCVKPGKIRQAIFGAYNAAMDII